MSIISNYRPRRVLTFIPGSVLSEKSDPLTQYAEQSLNGSIAIENLSDTLIFDIEDSVSNSFKSNAIKAISEFLESHQNKTKIEIAIRINAQYDTDLFEHELLLASHKLVDAIIIPKIDLSSFHIVFQSLHKCNKFLLPIVETTNGFQDKVDIIRHIKSKFDFPPINKIIPAVIIGLDDLSSDLRVDRDTFFTDSALSSMLGEFSCFARQFDFAAIGPVYNKFKDHQGLNTEVTRLKSIGYMGTLCVFPPYVRDIKRAFTPSDEEVETSIEILNKLQIAENSGKGWTFHNDTKYDTADKNKLEWTVNYGALCKQNDDLSKR
jgi:citrate lyase beta subunit